MILMFGGLIGISLGYFFPALSCPYVGSRGADCFLMNLQFSIGQSILVFYQSVGKRFLYFSILVIIVGRSWCGWVCPFGFIQDFLDLIRRKLGIGSLRFSVKLNKGLKCIKWIFLFFVIIVPLWVAFPVFAFKVAKALNMPFCQLCPGKYILPLVTGDPSHTAINFKSTTTIIMSVSGLLFSITAIIGALIKKRFWCPYCPMGLLISFYRGLSLLRLKKNPVKCTMCEICYNVCPMEIEQVFKEREKKDVTFADCILCLKCIENCPEDDACTLLFLERRFTAPPQKEFI